MYEITVFWPLDLFTAIDTSLSRCNEIMADCGTGEQARRMASSNAIKALREQLYLHSLLSIIPTSIFSGSPKG